LDTLVDPEITSLFRPL